MATESKVDASTTVRGCPQTRRALLAATLASEPLNALYTLLPVILYKNLHATPLQISIFITLRPCFSVFSFYWSSHLLYYKNRLIPNLIGAWVLARLPFVFLLFFPNFWFLMFAAAVYQLFSKAGIPSWIEILKRNIPKEPREHLFSLYNILSFLEGICLSFVIGRLLDFNPSSWNGMICIAAAVGLGSLFFVSKVNVPQSKTSQSSSPPPNRLLHPWKQGFQLLRERPDFARFQLGFMIGGSALMIMAPALSIFYVDTLSLSYSTITTARFVFMGIGVICSSLIWKRGLQRLPINFLICLILIGFCLFPVALLLAQSNELFVYVAFVIYGVAQAGSQLIWNLSGTIFAGEGESLPFTNVNILMLSIRGCVVPLLGGKLCEMLGPIPILFVGIAMTLFGILFMMRKKEYILST
ncbi:MAG: MFS transporter [Anaerolineae bacterium]